MMDHDLRSGGHDHAALSIRSHLLTSVMNDHPLTDDDIAAFLAQRLSPSEGDSNEAENRLS